MKKYFLQGRLFFEELLRGNANNKLIFFFFLVIIYEIFVDIPYFNIFLSQVEVKMLFFFFLSLFILGYSYKRFIYISNILLCSSLLFSFFKNEIIGEQLGNLFYISIIIWLLLLLKSIYIDRNIYGKKKTN